MRGPMFDTAIQPIGIPIFRSQHDFDSPARRSKAYTQMGRGV